MHGGNLSVWECRVVAPLKVMTGPVFGSLGGRSTVFTMHRTLYSPELLILQATTGFRSQGAWGCSIEGVLNEGPFNIITIGQLRITVVV